MEKRSFVLIQYFTELASIFYHMWLKANKDLTVKIKKN